MSRIEALPDFHPAKGTEQIQRVGDNSESCFGFTHLYHLGPLKPDHTVHPAHQTKLSTTPGHLYKLYFNLTFCIIISSEGAHGGMPLGQCQPLHFCYQGGCGGFSSAPFPWCRASEDRSSTLPVPNWTPSFFNGYF